MTTYNKLYLHGWHSNSLLSNGATFKSKLLQRCNRTIYGLGNWMVDPNQRGKITDNQPCSDIHFSLNNQQKNLLACLTKDLWAPHIYTNKQKTFGSSSRRILSNTSKTDFYFIKLTPCNNNVRFHRIEACRKIHLTKPKRLQNRLLRNINRAQWIVRSSLPWSQDSWG